MDKQGRHTEITPSPKERRTLRKLAAVGIAAALLTASVVAGVLYDRANSNDGTTNPGDELTYGVTIDRINNLDDTITALQKLPVRPISRVVFDENMGTDVYYDSVQKLKPHTDIMGEILDSYYVKNYSLNDYKTRMDQYMEVFGNDIAIWEVGNEINGEWLLNEGEPRSTVVEKVASAYDIVERQLGTSAITLYYNEGCFEKPEHEMFRWVRSELPPRIKNNVDYVFVSYYPEDCNNLKPNWDQVFKQLRQEFPSAKLGFGESGTTDKSQKQSYVREYYSTKPDVDNFVGGYFWWYFYEDMVAPFAKGDDRLLNTLVDVIKDNK